MKRAYISYICVWFLLLISSSATVWGQVSVWDKARIIGRTGFNYSPDADFYPSSKKNRTNRIVYSDRSGNQAYEDPYFQYKRNQHEIGTPYYIIGEENGTYELVQAEPDIFGKPKTFFSFLLDKKRHFKDPKKVSYIGWIPTDNVLMFSHAYIDEKNNQPIKFRVGITDLKRLFNLTQYFSEDTLNVYGEPYLKNRLKGGLLNGQIVYAYKYDKTKRTVLVSDCPSLEDSSRKIFGWVPADLIAEVGQNRAFLMGQENLSDSILGTQNVVDTFQIHEANMQSRILFDYAGNTKYPLFSEQENTEINVPVTVWNKHWNNLINIKGGNIFASDIRRMDKEQKKVNIHFLYFNSERKQAGIFRNTLQNMKLKLSPEKDYSFTATCISTNGNRYSSLTSDFVEWLDFIGNDSVYKKSLPSLKHAGLDAALRQILGDIDGPIFEKNLFVILGSKQTLNIKPDIAMKLAQKSSCLLFVQMNRSNDIPYQDFILEAKSVLSNLSDEYVDFISNYIVDDGLVKAELFRNVETEDANIYLYDVPSQSLSVGGIIFPKRQETLQNATLELALDSINSHIETINNNLLSSLYYHERKLGTLRSRPSCDLKKIFKRSALADSMQLAAINRNSISDAYFIKLSVPDSVLLKYKDGYIFSETELESLLQNYRGLLPEFADSICKKEFRVLRKVYRKQRKSMNRTFCRKVLKKKSVIADHFYYKTGIPANEELLQDLKIRHLKVRKCRKNNFHDIYPTLIDKLKNLEGMYMQNSYETVMIAGETYYFIPQNLLP